MHKYLLTLFIVLASICHFSWATEVNFHTWREGDKAVWQEINKQGLIPGVTVKTKVLAGLYYHDTLLLNLQSGRADLFLWTPGAAKLQELIELNLIAPYQKDLSQINASALVAAQGPNGQYYGVPFAVQLETMVVNKKMLKEHGITSPPQSMAELVSIFKTLKSAGINPLHIAGKEGWYMNQLVAEILVAGLVDEKFALSLTTGEGCFTDSRYVEIFKVLESWQQEGYVNKDIATTSYFDMFTAVALGNSAMSLEGGWMATKTSPYTQLDKDFEYDFWAIPGISGKYYGFGDGTFQVATNSEHYDAAKKVLEFTTTKTFAELFSEHVKQLPAYGGRLDIKPGILKNMSTVLAEKGYPVSLYSTYSLTKQKPTYNDLVAEAFKGLLNGQHGAKGAAELIQKGLNSWQYIGHQKCAL